MYKKAVLFDLDDTLYKYEFAHQKALKNVHKILNKYINIDFNKFIYFYQLSETEILKELPGTASSHNRVLRFQRLIEKMNHTIDPDMILALYEAYRGMFLRNLTLCEGVIDVLQYLKNQGIKTAIVSNSTTHIQLRKMSQLGIAPYIDYLITSEEAGSEKPNPKIFFLALNKLNVLPQDAIMVGDSLINDIEGANMIGIDTVLVADNYDKIETNEYKIPKYIIKYFKDFLGIITK